MLILSVTTTMPSKHRAAVWFLFETEADSLEEVVDRLRRDGIIHGNRIDSRRLEDGAREIVSRSAIGLGRAGVAQIELPRAPVHEAPALSDVA